MIKFENCEVLGWEHAIRGMRNPMIDVDKVYLCKTAFERITKGEK